MLGNCLTHQDVSKDIVLDTWQDETAAAPGWREFEKATWGPSPDRAGCLATGRETSVSGRM